MESVVQPAHLTYSGAPADHRDGTLAAWVGRCIVRQSGPGHRSGGIGRPRRERTGEREREKTRKDKAWRRVASEESPSAPTTSSSKYRGTRNAFSKWFLSSWICPSSDDSSDPALSTTRAFEEMASLRSARPLVVPLSAKGHQVREGIKEGAGRERSIE